MGKATQIYLVNGTPYQWTSKPVGSPHQMNSWDPPATIAPLSMTNFYAEWGQKIFTYKTEDAATTEYSMDGTSSSFQILARYIDDPDVKLLLSGMQTLTDAIGTTLDLGFTWNQESPPHINSMTIIVAGVEGNFVCNSHSQLNQTWLQSNISRWGSLPLTQLCLPASHDSGMSTVGFGTAMVSARNVQTQSNSIGAQLGYGVRFFDIRPVVSHGDYYTGHYSNTHSGVLNWQGADGQKITDIVNHINEFTLSNAELVVLELSHAYDTDGDYSDFNQTQWDGLFSQLAQLNNLYVPPPETDPKDLTQLTLNQFIGSRKAAVVLYVDFNAPTSPTDLTLGGYAGSGFFYQSQFPIVDDYSDTYDPQTVISDQFTKLRAARGSNISKVFSLDWTLTQTTALETEAGIPLLQLGEDMNSWLAQSIMNNYNPMNPSCNPQLLSMDNVKDTTGLTVATLINELAIKYPMSA